MPKDRPPSYTPAPSLPTDPVLRRRIEEVLATIAGTQTMTGGAVALGMSRNHYQTVVHRALEAAMASVTPKPAGRPARSARELELEAENATLRRQVRLL